jgi:hypothetical protein
MYKNLKLISADDYQTFINVMTMKHIDLRVCVDGKLVHILCSWTLSIVSSLSKILTKNNVSEIGFYLRLQVKPTQLGTVHSDFWILTSSSMCNFIHILNSQFKVK